MTGHVGKVGKNADTSVLFFRLAVLIFPCVHAGNICFAFCCDNYVYNNVNNNVVDEWTPCKLKSWSNMHCNGISRYFAAYFELLLLCYFFA